MAAKKPSKHSSLTFLTLGLFAFAAVAPVTRSFAKNISATTLELSAQHDANKDPKNKFQRRRTNVQQQNGQPRQQFQRKDIIKQNNPVHVQQNIQVKKKVIVVAPNGQRKFVGHPKVFKPTHNNLVYKFTASAAPLPPAMITAH